MKDRLLKRMSRWEQSQNIEHDDIDTNALVDSIRDDVEKLLNTKRGTVLIDDDFGLPDFSHMLNGYSAPDANSILQQIHLQIKRYEPRIQGMHVKYIEQSRYAGKLQFQITARINYKGQEVPFNAVALLSDDGSISVGSTS